MTGAAVAPEGVTQSSGSRAGACTGSPPSLEEIHRLPKVELHAHLSGSIKQPFLLEMMRKRGMDPTGCGLPFNAKEDLRSATSKCFNYFRNVARVVTDLEAVRECAQHVFESFAAENCVYLELRTSPKEFACRHSGEDGQLATRTSKEDYVRTVVDCMRSFRGPQRAAKRPRLSDPPADDCGAGHMEIRLLLSIDRGSIHSVEDARSQLKDVVGLCRKFADDVVGIDVCGDPGIMTVEPFLFPALQELREADPEFFLRFPITMHTAEIGQNFELVQQESDLIVKNLEYLNIRRLGHVTYLTEPQREAVMDHWRAKQLRKIGVELCPTSNLVSKGADDVRQHHFPLWYTRDGSGQPLAGPANGSPSCKSCSRWRGREPAALVSVNTDDRGLFSTGLSEELHIVAQAFELCLEDVRELQRQALESSFARDKDALRLLLSA